jgi:hypothetical protein
MELKNFVAFDALQQLRDALMSQFTGVNTTSLFDKHGAYQ